MFSFIEVPRNRHEHGSRGSPPRAKEKSEKVKVKDGGHVLIEEEKEDSQGEAGPPEGKRDLSSHSIGEPSPEESKEGGENASSGKKGCGPYFIHPQVHQISHMVNDNDVDAKDGKAWKEEKKPEPALFHLLDEEFFSLIKEQRRGVIVFPMVFSFKDRLSPITIREEPHLLRPVFQEDGIERKGNDENQGSKDKVSDGPSMIGDKILEEGDEHEGTDSNSHPCQAVRHASLSLKPVGKDDRERDNTEGRDANANDQAVEEIKLSDRLNP